jgi:hypothetical protein
LRAGTNFKLWCDGPPTPLPESAPALPTRAYESISILKVLPLQRKTHPRSKVSSSSIVSFSAPDDVSCSLGCGLWRLRTVGQAARHPRSGEARPGSAITLSMLYTSSMDRVRFGRALGIGARHAVKTLVTAVDAATAENPAARSTAAGTKAAPSAASPQPRVSPPPSRPASAVQTAAKTVAQAREVHKGIRRGGRRFGEAIWSPFVRLSGVLWLEVSGVFFGIFALLALGYLEAARRLARGSGQCGESSHPDRRRDYARAVRLLLRQQLRASQAQRATAVASAVRNVTQR